MWTYTVLSYKEVGCLKSKTTQCLANHEAWNFFRLAELTLRCPMKHPWPPNHPPPLTTALSHSLTLLLHLGFFPDKLKLKSTKVCFLLSALHPFKPWWKMAAFPKTIAMIGQATSSWPIIKSQQIMPSYITNKKQNKKKAAPAVENYRPFSFSADRWAYSPTI